MAISFNAAKLSYCEAEAAASAGGAPALTELKDLQEVPDLGSDAEKIDVTVLTSFNKEYIKGIGDPGSLDFKFLYSNAEGSAYTLMRAAEEANKLCFFELEFSDHSAFSFTGQVSTKVNGGGVNAAVQFTLSITVTSKIDYDNDKTGA